MPLKNDPNLKEIFLGNSRALFGEEECCQVGHRTGSTDMGDISHIMPSLHPWMSGAGGPSHSAEYQITDKGMIYLAPAKSLAMMAVDLLFGDAGQAKSVLKNHKPVMTPKEYLAFQEKVFLTEHYDGKTGISKDIP